MNSCISTRRVLMTALTAQPLRLLCTARTEVVLPLVSGPVVRGALLDLFCHVQGGAACGFAQLFDGCPICPLVATDEDGVGWPDKAAMRSRPFTVELPLRRGLVPPGEPFEFGLTVFGDPARLLPLLLAGVARMAARGIGARGVAPGLFDVCEVWAVDPLRGLQRRIPPRAGDDPTAHELPVTHDSALAYASRLAQDTVTLELLEPLRLIDAGALAHTLTFQLVARRLLRRIDGLALSTTGAGLALPFTELVEAAGAVRVTRDETRWLDVESYSGRTRRSTSIGGLVGRVTFAGGLAPFLPWLAWGQVTHVGKDATKGNGWYLLA